MTSTDTIWRRLGLEATGNVWAIRKAYTQRLKALNVDADPTGFIMLREALERALAYAALRNPTVGEVPADQPDPHAHGLVGPGSIDLEDVKNAVALAAEPRPPHRAEVRIAGAEVDRGDLARLTQLLYGNDDGDAVRGEIRRLTLNLLNHPALDRIDQADELETWMATTIAAASPRSDLMIDLAVTHFGWGDSKADWRQTPAVRQVLQRKADIGFLSGVAGPGHRWNRAYRELKRPLVKRLLLPGDALVKQVRFLLDAIHRDHPTVLRDLDPQSLAWWKERSRRKTPFSDLWSRIALHLPGGARIWDAPPTRKLKLNGIIRLILFPYIGVWFLLRSGFSAKIRLLAFSWLAIWCAGFLFLNPGFFSDTTKPKPQSVRTSGEIDIAAAGNGLPTGCAWRPDTAAAISETLFCPDASGNSIPSKVPPNFDNQTFIKAAKGDTSAMVAAGLFFVAGPSTQHNVRTAVAWFQKAAAKGDKTAMVDLGLLYGQGKGVNGDGPDEAEAVRWYRAAADKGSAAGLYLLGGAEVRGRAVAKDLAGAVSHFRRSAEMGYAPAMSALGRMYAEGLGVRKDPTEAVHQYRNALDRGDPQAMLYLGEAYSLGEGVPKSQSMAAALLQQAADHGVVHAWVDLGVLAVQGLDGPTGPAKAARLFRKAADAKDPVGMYDLGLLYEMGRGVSKDEVLAKKWIGLAANRGFQPAIQHAAKMGE